MSSLGNRARQFRQATIPPSDADIALARSALGQGPLFELFIAQAPRDVRHAVNTARWLLDRGHTDPELVAAALVHDVGKGPQRRRDRVAWVVAGWLGAGKLAASGTSRFEMRRAMARSAIHSETGATMLEQAGAPGRVVYLTANHHAGAGGDAMLILLQAADAAN